MTSKTEAALVALTAAIEAKSALNRNVLPAPLRNESLPARLFEATNNLETYLNIWDGDTTIDDEMVGADVIADCYELQHDAEVEFAVAGGTAAVREAAFDAGVAAILAAIAADRTLGGKVDTAHVTNVASKQRDLATEGLTNVKGAVLTVRLEFSDSDIR